MITKQEFTGYLAASEQTYTFLSQMLFRELNEEAIEGEAFISRRK